jgi:Ca-activated chloride channel family protein
MKSHALLISSFLLLSGVVIFSNLGRHERTVPKAAEAATPPPAPAVPTIELLFATSDGKKEWVEEATKDWDAKGLRVNGKAVHVKLEHMRSGDSLKKVLAGSSRPHLWSPVSRSWIHLVDEQWQLRYHHDFLEEVRPTARTALVIATWEPMARALGWPDKPIGWADFVKVANEPTGWAAYGHPEWGTFKLGHAHPDYSTSANLSLASLCYARTGKRADLAPEDLERPDVVSSLAALERGIVHYGESAGWLTEKMCTLGPSYLSAVPLYEANVIKANEKFPKKAFPLVAIYPREGTFWEEHPAGVVNADWVSSEEREAAKLYLDFLGSPEEQAKTAHAGFRPASPEPADANALAPVSDEVFKRLSALWHRVKKKSTVYLLVDTSGSMNGEPMNAARRGAEGVLRRREPDDEVQVIAVSDAVRPLGRLGPIREVGEPLTEKVRGLFAQGNTALYDAIGLALDEIERAKKDRAEPRLYGIVLLTDGMDTSSRTQKLDLLSRLPKREDAQATRIFTIGYGPDADLGLLRELSERTNAVSAKGDEPQNLERIYLSLSSYF